MLQPAVCYRSSMPCDPVVPLGEPARPFHDIPLREGARLGGSEVRSRSTLADHRNHVAWCAG